MGLITWRDRKSGNSVSVNTQPGRFCSIDSSTSTLSTLADLLSSVVRESDLISSLLARCSASAYHRKQFSMNVLSVLRYSVSSTLGMAPRRRRTLGAPPSRAMADEISRSSYLK